MKTETMINDLKGNLTEEEMASVHGGLSSFENAPLYDDWNDEGKIILEEDVPL